MLNNPELETVLSKGASFRQVSITTVLPAQRAAVENAQTIIATLLHPRNKLGLSTSDATHLYETLLRTILDRISRTFRNTEHVSIRDLENRRQTQQHLDTAHKRFILIPIDKASNNIGIICKKFYVQLLNQELGITFNNGQLTALGNDTYEPFTDSLPDLFQKHQTLTQRYCKNDLDEDNRVIPRLWLTLKCHKNPVKFRFISGARLCSTKQLSITLATALKMFRAHFLRYTTAIEQQRGYSFNWSVNNSDQVKRKLQSHTSNGKLTIADFSTLYTAFEHDTILRSMFFLVQKLFKHSHASYLAIGAHDAYFHSHDQGNRQRLTPQDVMHLIETVVTNSYVQHLGLVFWQKKGLPMGGNAAPALADLCLSVIEYQYIHSHPSEARRLSLTSRYIDDILTVNSELMLTACKDIYPPSLPLNFDDTSNGLGHFLDLQLDRNTGTISLFDKRDDFNFNVIRLTDASSNNPHQLGRTVFFSQALRITRICSHAESFKIALRHLIATIRTRGYSMQDVANTLHKLNQTYPTALKRFGLGTKGSLRNWLRTLPSGNS